MSSNSVKRWMTGDPVSIDGSSSAYEALELMVRRGIRHLPVVDAERRVLGVLSFDDIRAAVNAPVSWKASISDDARREATRWSVAELMNDSPIVAREDEALSSAADLLADARIGCLPVVDDTGRLVGLLSETDALRALGAAARSYD